MMQPAEKTHYRKGLALGLTMAEIFSIIVFILLLLCGILLEQQRNELDDVKADLFIARSFIEDHEPLALTEINWLDAYRELRDSLDITQKRNQYLRNENRRIEAENEVLLSSLQSSEIRSRLPQQVASYKGRLEVLKDSLGQAVEDLRRMRQRNKELENRLGDSHNLYEAAISTLERVSHLDSIQIVQHLQGTVQSDSLEEELNRARDTITKFDNLKPFRDSLDNIPTEDSLRIIATQERKRSEDYRKKTRQATRERDEAVGHATYLKGRLNQLTGGQGIDPPPCWLSGENRPEYIFRIELTNSGFQAFNLAPPSRIDDPVMSYLEAIQDGYEYAPSQFLDKTRPIYDEGRGRTNPYGPSGCRFWIRPVDKTGSSKEVFQSRNADLGRHFWYRW